MSLFLVLGIVFVCFSAILVFGACAILYRHVCKQYWDKLLNIVQVKPFFLVPRCEPRADAEDITFPSFDGLLLRGAYMRTHQPRKGVIMFGLEFGSDRWSCQTYCETLLQNGYDVFAYEPRNQGESEAQEGYSPLQWLTIEEVEDAKAALRYLKTRDDADPKGVGFFGISKGANAGLAAAAQDRWVKCLITDGAFGMYSVMVPYMRRWVSIYSDKKLLQALLPQWFYGLVASLGVRRVEQVRGVKYASIEDAMKRLRRPLLMIHGEADNYIKPEMAAELLKRATGPKALWVVEGAKHNQAIQMMPELYNKRVLEFFDLHLVGIEPALVPSQDSAPSESEGASTGA